METFISIFSNVWVIGIGTGIVSGIIVYFVTNKFFTYKVSREYLQKINNANTEILYSLRSFLVDEKLPSEDIFNSIINATALTYKVKREDLFTEKQLADKLIKEITDNPFLNSENRILYSECAKKIGEYNIKPQKEDRYLLNQSKKNKDSILIPSITLSSLASVLSGLSYVYTYSEKISSVRVPIYIVILVGIFFVLINEFVIKTLFQSRKQNKESKEDKPDSKSKPPQQ